MNGKMQRKMRWVISFGYLDQADTGSSVLLVNIVDLGWGRASRIPHWEGVMTEPPDARA